MILFGPQFRINYSRSWKYWELKYPFSQNPGNIGNHVFLFSIWICLFATILEIYGTLIFHISSYPGNIENCFCGRVGAGGTGQGGMGGGSGTVRGTEPPGGRAGGVTRYMIWRRHKLSLRSGSISSRTRSLLR